MIGIIDAGLGNIFSVTKGFRRAGVSGVRIVRHSDDFEGLKGVVLPGVGHFSEGLKRLEDGGWLEVLNKWAVTDKRPILGICLGMQLMTSYSEEGQGPGLGWIDDTETLEFRSRVKDASFKYPHVMWNSLDIKLDSPLLEGVTSEEMFYFVHSYYVESKRDSSILSTSEYGVRFVSAFSKGNVYGVQFHPEKSHQQGMRILNNFARLSGVSS